MLNTDISHKTSDSGPRRCQERNWAVIPFPLFYSAFLRLLALYCRRFAPGKLSTKTIHNHETEFDIIIFGWLNPQNEIDYIIFVSSFFFDANWTFSKTISINIRNAIETFAYRTNGGEKVDLTAVLAWKTDPNSAENWSFWLSRCDKWIAFSISHPSDIRSSRVYPANKRNRLCGLFFALATQNEILKSNKKPFKKAIFERLFHSIMRCVWCPAHSIRQFNGIFIDQPLNKFT